MPIRPLPPSSSLLCLLVASALAGCASGPNTTLAANTPTTTECPDVTRLGAGQLYGSWLVELTQTGQRGTLTLRQHPEYAASLRGLFHYAGVDSIASGDVEDGEFNLDESRDGKSLFAFWSGKLVPSACGAEIRGTWQTVPAPGQPARESPFVLRRDNANW
jgi:hypothetical protein